MTVITPIPAPLSRDAIARVRVIALALTLAACPGDVAFVASDTIDTDTTDATDTSVDSATTSDVEVDTGPCAPTCQSDFAYGICGDDGCGGTCYCAAAQSCDVDLCSCLVGCDSIVDTHVQPNTDGTTDLRGQAIVASFREAFPDQFDLVLRRFTNVTWEFEVITPDVKSPCTIGIELLEGEPYLLMESGFSSTSTQTWYRRHDGQWQARELGLCAEGTYAQLRATPQGLFASCVDGDALELVLARLDDRSGEDPSWVEIGRYGSIGISVLGPSLGVLPLSWTIDAMGRPHVAYTCCGPGPFDLWYAYRGSDDWHVEDFGAQGATAGATVRNVAIGIDRADHPHIVHQAAEGTQGKLVHRRWDGQVWLSETLATAAAEGKAIGQVLKLVTDSKRDFHIVYRDDERLAYRRFDGFEWSAPSLSPQVVSVDDGVSISVDASDTAHVLYVDSNDQLVWWTPPAPL